ncbi:hypothetical protein CcCBS67573_g08646 [Chytriomyces confervae]|uniref:V-SNARE coiled-coil homology domain-containing protein n=1 Tax=Chytriomyces confervae TaxID=246404 RepID=A0A507EIE5_9FUNG|nr:hypothetical protein CcCBS67573_g08646 [Chytriomyces confervae]
MASNSKVNTVQKQVDEVVNLMTDNIAKVVQRGENLEQLQNKTDDLQQSAMQFKKGASAVRKEMWWKDMKMKMILGGVLGVIVIIIICECASRFLAAYESPSNAFLLPPLLPSECSVCRPDQEGMNESSPFVFTCILCSLANVNNNGLSSLRYFAQCTVHSITTTSMFVFPWKWNPMRAN